MASLASRLLALLAAVAALAAGVAAGEGSSSTRPWSTDLAVKWFSETVKERDATVGDGTITGSTILAPTDAAFKALAALLHLDSVEGLVAQDEETKRAALATIAYHVIVDKKLWSKEVPEGATTVTTASGMPPPEEGLPLTVYKKNGHILFKGGGKNSWARVVKADIEFGDNVVHVIDAVLLPEGLDAYGLDSSISRTHSHAADVAPAAAAEGGVVEGMKAAMAKLHAKLVAIAKGAGTHVEEQHKEHSEHAEGHHSHHHEQEHAHSDEGHHMHAHEHKD